MSCGAAHTLALSTDMKTVWSFGAGDHGKLGDQGCQVLLVDQGGGGGTPPIRNLTNLVFARGGIDSFCARYAD